MVTHFESLLPVALALGVGKTLANTFARYLSSTGAMSEVLQQTDWRDMHHFYQSCHSAASEKPAQRSEGGSSGSGYSGSGSSGGGSSGGGSGGGGGGGW